MRGVVFRKAQNRIQDPAKLRRLIVDLIDRESWLTLDADVKGNAYECLLEKDAEDAGDFETAARGAARRGPRRVPPPDDGPCVLGLWRQTKDELWHDRWWRVHVQLNESAAAYGQVTDCYLADFWGDGVVSGSGVAASSSQRR